MIRLSHPRFLAFLVAFAAVGGWAATGMSWSAALLTGFDAAAVLFIALSLPLFAGREAARLREDAARNDAGRGLMLLVSAIVLLVMFAAVGVELGNGARRGIAGVAVPVATLALAWLFGNLVYTFHYAHLFYGSGPDGGLEFPGGAAPDYADFAYFAFTVGMTFQVSDVVITDRAIRRTVLLHGILSFAFNIGLLALTVNVAAGLL